MTASTGVGRAAALVRHCYKHGHARVGQHSGAYRAWRSMFSRCKLPSQDSYPMYGGAGIKVCERWESFESFLADMGDRPHGCSLDRIDSTGDYKPANCRWATAQEQARNRKSNRRLDHAGKNLLVVEWAELTGIPSEVIRARLDRYKWTVAEALTIPVVRPVLHIKKASRHEST